MKKPTVKQVVKNYFTSMNVDDVFYIMNIIHYVRTQLAEYSKRPMDGTITRKLRELRQDGFINYIVLNKREGKYELVYKLDESKITFPINGNYKYL